MKDLWRLLHLENDNPLMNMAFDEAILMAVEKDIAPNTVRFWRNRRAVLIGYSQSVEREVCLEACRKNGVSVVRRFTGGGAVYQNHGNLNWTVAVRKADLPAEKISDVVDIFKVFSRPIIQGLQVLGVCAEFKLPNGICLGNKKISGMAAYVKRESLLCHGTLLVNGDLRLVRDVLKNLKIEVTTVEEALTWPISMVQAKDAIVKGFDIAFGIEMKQGGLSNEEEAIAMSLYEKKYATRQWNYMR